MLSFLNKVDFKYGIISRVFGLGSNLIVIPFTLSYLDAADFAVWMILVSMYSLVTIFDFGFSATISRFFSYSLNGVLAQDIIDGKFNSDKAGINFDSYGKIKEANNKVFRYLLLIGSVFLVLLFIVYTHFATIELSNHQQIAWVLFSIAIYLSLWSVKYNGLIHGSGNVHRIYINTILSTVCFLMLAMVFIYIGLGVIGLALARLISAMVLAYSNFITDRSISLKLGVINSTYCSSIYNKLTTTALKLGVAGLGNFLSNRMTLYMLSAFLVLDNISGVSLIINVAIIMLSTSLIVLNNNLPVIVKFTVEKNSNELKKKATNTIFTCLSIYTVIYMIFVSLLPFAIEVLDSEVSIPTASVLLLVYLIYFLEILVSVSTAIIASQDNLIFAKYQLLSGASFIVICIGIKFSGFASIESILLAQLLVQLSINSWRWPLLMKQKIKKVL